MDLPLRGHASRVYTHPGRCPDARRRTSTRTARGRLRARLASPLAARARARRHARFFALTGVAAGHARRRRRLRRARPARASSPALDVTGVDLVAAARATRGRSSQADATAGAAVRRRRSSTSPTARSVVEHVAPARRAAFAAEVRRVARGWYVQTPGLRRSRSSPTPCCRSRTGCRPALRRALLAPGRDGRLGGHRAAAPPRARGAVRRRPRPERVGPLRQELGGRASGRATASSCSRTPSGAAPVIRRLTTQNATPTASRTAARR